ncbi:hypothetical protein GCM10007968_17440 [Sporolactobacillus putidus]|uniref:Uncharacterized protein n=1 Tax=Sporolactobacillus putidus TaxID=492735 RepID=A0A917W262_9BACL|nr:hypothetical protein GCM10007968_17440 [Sporolactobacillus putidus]
MTRNGFNAFVHKSFRLTFNPKPIMAVVKINEEKEEIPFITFSGSVNKCPST